MPGLRCPFTPVFTSCGYGPLREMVRRIRCDFDPDNKGSTWMYGGIIQEWQSPKLMPLCLNVNQVSRAIVETPDLSGIEERSISWPKGLETFHVWGDLILCNSVDYNDVQKNSLKWGCSFEPILRLIYAIHPRFCPPTSKITDPRTWWIVDSIAAPPPHRHHMACWSRRWHVGGDPYHSLLCQRRQKLSWQPRVSPWLVWHA